MGSNISFGIVFDKYKHKNKLSKIELLIAYFTDATCFRYKYSYDLNGKKWLESTANNPVISQEEIISTINGFYGEISFTSKIFSNSLWMFTLKVECEEDFYGIIVEFQEDHVKDIGYENFENKIIKFLKSLYNTLGYDYAFCDNEGEIEYSPDEINNSPKEIYSILIKKLGGKLDVIKSSWSIDGLTSRDI